ncbi:MAG: M23 family metallopeptidase, partial [Flavobacteriales bacterium]|nr:M23 family metallopeptidase [Flavobacteriales bacterium]
MKFINIALFLAFIFNTSHANAQDNAEITLEKKLFSAPMRHKQILAGSFAELRDAHFHSGIDFKTEQTEGKPIFAPARGYVSRISVAHGGYGKALYITHDNGYTTVYGHLSAYAPMLDSLLRAYQYENQSYTADISFEKGKIDVKEGTLVAWSGNTGGSGGPHLHFEIRKTDGNVPLNPLAFGFSVKDHRSPTIRGIYVMNTEGTDSMNYISHPRAVSFSKNTSSGKTMALGKIGIAVDAYDTMDDAPNVDGIYSIAMYINGEKAYGVKMDAFPLEKTKQIDLHVLYDYYVLHGVRMIKCFKDPQNTLPIYDT